MKLKVVALSFLITTFLSLNFVVPQLVQEHLQAYLGDVQKSLALYGLTLNFEDVRMSYIPLKIRIRNLNVVTINKEKVFAANKVDFSSWSFSELVNVIQGDMRLADLSKLKMSIQQLEFNEKYLSPRLRSALTSLGYNKLILNIVSDYKYDLAGKEFLLNEFSVEGYNMGKINIRLHLTDFAVPSLMDINNLVGLNQSSVKYFSVEYQEDSLMKNVKILAAKDNIPLERYLAFAKKMEGQRDPANTEENEISAGLQKFIENPISMRLALAPEKGIPFKDISLMIMLSPTKLIESFQPSLIVNGSEVQIPKGN